MKYTKFFGRVFIGPLIFFSFQLEAGETIVPFIKAEHHKQNISLSEFRKNPRGYFRSDSAFNLLVGYVEQETSVAFSNSEFTALIRDDAQVRTRNCPTDEEINTGALEGDQFFWFERECRDGEQIVQLFFDDHWIDLFSLNCLNAVEDKTPVPTPILVRREQIVYLPPVKRTRNTGYIPDNNVSYVPSVSIPNGCGDTSQIMGGFIQHQNEIQSNGYGRRDW
jgi:hypothetical protein